MKPMFAALLAAALLAAPAPARAQASPTARDLLESMLASDSIQVARVEVDVHERPDSTGANHRDLTSRRVSINIVRGAWMRRFAAQFLPAGTETRAELCPTPIPAGGIPRPWMVSVLWIQPQGRGQAYMDFGNRCGFAGLAGSKPVGVEVGPHADSLLALCAEALPADTLLARVTPASLRGDAGPVAEEALPKYGQYVAVDELAEVIGKVTPVYPPEAWAAGVGGLVLVQALVGRDGGVKDAIVSVHQPLLDAAAVAAVRRFRFKPARLKGVPTAVWVAVPVTFTPHGRAGGANAGRPDP
jgi:TonB family protein